MINFGGDIGLSYSEIERYGISQNTIWSGVNRGIWKSVKHHGSPYVIYDSIPAQTRSKLPSKEELYRQLKEQQQALESLQQYTLESRLKEAMERGHTEFIASYEALGCSRDKCLQLAQAAALLQVAVEVYNAPRNTAEYCGYKTKEAFYEAYLCALKKLSAPYLKLENARYLKRKLQEAAQAGPAGAIRLPRAGNQNRAILTDWHKYAIEAYYANPKNYVFRQIVELVAEACERQGFDVPTESTIKAYCNRPEVRQRTAKYRLGEREYKRHLQGHIVRQGPLYPGDVWQLDGTRAGFWYADEGGKPAFLDWMPVIDGHSLAILGYSVGRNEDQWMVREALKMASKFTGYVPYELLTDNGSAMLAKETTDLLKRLAGVRTTQLEDFWRRAKVGNARDKTIERFFQTFQNYEGRRYDNYVGEGILSRRKNARPSPEFLAEARRKALPSLPDLLRQIAEMVAHYNHYRANDRPSAMDRYKATEPVNATALPLHTQALIFWERRLVTVRNSLVKLTLRHVEHVYQVDELRDLNRVNGQQVYAFYDPADLDSIQLFEAGKGDEVGDFVCMVRAAKTIHSARANQTQQDVVRLARHSDRIERIEREQQEQIEVLRRKAEAIAPVEDAVSLHLLDLPKAASNELESSTLTRLFLDERGITTARYEPELVPVQTPYHSSEPRRRRSLFAADTDEVSTELPRGRRNEE